MYTRCLFCAGDLGRNEAVEAFPVGRRLAFDAVKGRLWVVCPRCARWNLTPLEERWEAIEQAERLFRATGLRFSTENVGLARLRDGAELVRVGRALRPEFAAWRYRAGGEWRRRAVQGVAAGGLWGGSAVLGFSALALGAPFNIVLGAAATSLAGWARHGVPHLVVARVPSPEGTLAVRRRHLRRTLLLPGEAGTLDVVLARDRGEVLLRGDAARRAAAVLLPASNWLAGDGADVRRAVERLEQVGTADQFVADFARRAARLTRDGQHRRVAWLSGASGQHDPAHPATGLMALEPSLRLAAEMALHEDDERRAFEGELARLEQAWRDAEEIAAIADTLVLPSAVERAFTRLRGRTDSAAG